MTEPIIERHERWEPVEGIDRAAARVVVQEDHEGLVITMMFSEIGEGQSSNLRIRFGRVAGYSVYEEFVHPWYTPQTESPMIGEGSRRCVFPLLLIHNSEWVHSLSDRLLGFPNSVHYRLLTLDEVVDVLCNKQPEVNWVAG